MCAYIDALKLKIADHISRYIGVERNTSPIQPGR